MKKLLLIPLMFALAGAQCNPDPSLIRTKYHVVIPPQELFECPMIRKFPDYRTLNDVEVAKTLVTLYKNNVKCKNSILAVEKFLKEAKEKIEK